MPLSPQSLGLVGVGLAIGLVLGLGMQAVVLLAFVCGAAAGHLATRLLA
eukprot:CAMPEP_0177662758 /NCGR_PEP_ID=MMETSP0447-20121125/19496_1 /TAXON_ID=0 /ORGANISM="Stygamoeba regulata, Strain BSH-02190019" /LENGTH=48 /DNA_ID= /DNA_START= /DNA_END= /DNA_ORIENTATION=